MPFAAGDDVGCASPEKFVLSPGQPPGLGYRIYAPPGNKY
jgi:hypothetical protein